MLDMAATADSNGAGGCGDTLKQQVLISHFSNATGCTVEQARQLLLSHRWEFETALSVYFQETGIVPINQRHPGHANMCQPCNTPATPPNLGEALLALQKLQAGGGSDWLTAGGSSSPPAAAAPFMQHNQAATAANVNVLTVCNHLCTTQQNRYSGYDWPTGAQVSASPSTQFWDAASVEQPNQRAVLFGTPFNSGTENSHHHNQQQPQQADGLRHW